MNSKLKPLIPIGLSCLILSGSIIGVSGVTVARNNEVNKLQTELVSQQNKLEQLKASSSAKTSEVKIESLGVNFERVQNDETLATELLDMLFNWSSYDEYVAIREKLMADYNLDANSTFLNTFMPEIYNEEIDGKKYNRIDIDGYNIRLNEITPYLVSSNLETGEYGYFAVAEVASSSRNGGTSRYNVALEYKTNSSGKLLDLKGYTLN